MNLAFIEPADSPFVNRLSGVTAFPLYEGAFPPEGEPVVLVVPSAGDERQLVIDFCVDRWLDVVGVVGTRFAWEECGSAARKAAVLADAMLIGDLEHFVSAESVELLNETLKELDASF